MNRGYPDLLAVSAALLFTPRDEEQAGEPVVANLPRQHRKVMEAGAHASKGSESNNQPEIFSLTNSF